MLIFAEGTQNRTNEMLQPFKDGAFRIAIDTQTPILPLVVIGAGKLMPPGKLRIRPGIIKIVAGTEIAVNTYQPGDVSLLKEHCYQTMLGLLQEHVTDLQPVKS